MTDELKQIAERAARFIEERDPFGDQFSQREIDVLRGTVPDRVSEESIQTSVSVSLSHSWLDANMRMREDGLYFDSDGRLYRPATKDEAQHGLNDTWPGDPYPA